MRPPTVAAQVVDTTRPQRPPDSLITPLGDTLRPAPTAEDSARRAAADSSPLKRYLALQERTKVKVLAPARLGPEGPAPARSRIVFTRDSLDWSGAATVGDLLARVPGLYLWRGGWLGQPELPNFQGRGATSVEYYFDGLPYVPAGVDSVGVDPSILSLGIFDRVEIERWPGFLRVWLYTPNYDRLAPRSRVGFARGSRDFARYRGSLEKRTRSGPGFALEGENVTVPTVAGVRSKYANTLLFAQGSYLPSPHWGVLYQVLRSRPDRDPTIDAAGDTLSRGITRGNRTDVQLRGMWRHDTTGLGARADLLLGRITAGDSLTPSQRVHQVGLVGSYRWPTASLGASAFYRTRWTSLDLRANGGWQPRAGFTLAGEAGYQRHDGGRSSDWLGARAGIELPYGFHASGSARVGSIVAAPALLSDAAQAVRDWQGSVGWERSWGAVEATYSRTSAWLPLAYQQFPVVPAIAPSSATEWITLGGRLTPLSWITVEGWYSNPRGAVPEGVPPRHVYGAGTIRTHLSRIFPSRILDIKLRLGVEHWDNGVIGNDAFGNPMLLPRATYLRSLVEIAFGSLQFYWDRSNLTLEAAPYVPGLPIVGRPSEIGIRWTFAN